MKRIVLLAAIALAVVVALVLVLRREEAVAPPPAAQSGNEPLPARTHHIALHSQPLTHARPCQLIIGSIVTARRDAARS